jgi:hypothetical protein
MNAMNVPKFSAEASLYKTSAHYHHLSNAFAQANKGVIQSAFTQCEGCHHDNTGACVQNCSYCFKEPGYGLVCFTYTKACNEDQC